MAWVLFSLSPPLSFPETPTSPETPSISEILKKDLIPYALEIL